MHAALDAGERQVLMQVGRRRDGDGIDAPRPAAVRHRRMPGSPSTPGHELALLAIGIGNADELHAGKVGEDARMIAAHDADADNPHA